MRYASSAASGGVVISRVLTVRLTASDVMVARWSRPLVRNRRIPHGRLNDASQRMLPLTRRQRRVMHLSHCRRPGRTAAAVVASRQVASML
jgi:hypothetical protein